MINKILTNGEFIQVQFEYAKEMVSNSGVMTIATKNGTFSVKTAASEFDRLAKGLGAVGTFVNVYSAASDIASYQQGEISGKKLAFRLTGTAASAFAPMVYGAAVGTEAGGPGGTLIGIGVGFAFGVTEYSYPKIIKGINLSIFEINSFERSLRNWGAALPR